MSVDVERTVDAPIDEVWSVLCDYEHARPRMLPAHFADYAIQVGGQGVGTVIAYVLRVSRRRETRQAAFGAGRTGLEARSGVGASGVTPDEQRPIWTYLPPGLPG